MHFRDKVVWITGASSGIGKSLALQLAKKNVILILTARNLENLQIVKNEIAQISKSTCHILPFDLMNVENLSELVQSAFALEGRINCSIMSAGISQRSVVADTQINVYRQLMEINYFAPVAIIKNLLPIYDKQNGGNITVLSSVAGLFGFPLRAGYSAAKHALTGFAETLQCELYKSKIVVTIVYPGRIDTNISRNAVDGKGNKLGISDENNTVGMNVEDCASRIISAIEGDKRSIIIAKSELLLYKVWWYWRSLFYKIAYAKGMKQ